MLVACPGVTQRRIALPEHARFESCPVAKNNSRLSHATLVVDTPSPSRKQSATLRLLAILRALGVPVHPVFRILVKGRPVALELVRNTRLHCVIRLRSREDCPDQREHIPDLVWRLPLVRTQHAQAHGASIVIRDIWVVNLGFEADARWLEGVVFGKSHVDLEVSALVGLSVLLRVSSEKMLDEPHRQTRLGLAW